MATDPQPPESQIKRDWRILLAWIGGISAVLGFVGAVSGTFGKIEDHFRHRSELDTQMSVAQSQLRLADYQAAVESYADVLKTKPMFQPALDQQLSATMLWVENFSVVEPDGQNATGLGAAQLDQMFSILEAGLARTKGSEAADIEAHLGWAHWLNQHIAEREFGPVAEHDLRAALVLDPANVYANAMLGNWLLQNGGGLGEAVADFHAAVATGKARPLVRSMQIGGLLSSESGPAHVELMRAANEMRKDNDPLDQREKGRILFECFGPSMEDREQMVASLSAVPPNDAYQTFVWLDDAPRDGDDAKSHQLTQAFVQASVLEIDGQRAEALAKYQALQQELKNGHSTLEAPVAEAIARLLHG